jgi:hypothetical protein
MKARCYRCLFVASLAVIALMGTAASANAFLYFGQGNGSLCPIGRANLNGTGLNHDFILSATCHSPAVDATHIYWTASPGPNDVIGRANIDGTHVNPSFIKLHGSALGIAVDTAHIYWTNATGIGRANLNGTGVDPTFMNLGSGTIALAVDSSHIYWSDSSGIGRANLDGTQPTRGFIAGGPDVDGIAVDSAHIYWANFGGLSIMSPPGTIGRANLDGTGANPDFITGAHDPSGIGVEGAYIYWANYGSGTIGRANLDGSNANENFIRRAGATGLAVDARTPQTTHQPTYFFGNVAATIKTPGMPVQGEAIRPSRIYLLADGSAVLVKLHWTGWGSKVAHANGTISASNGNPNQAQGRRILTPAQITVSSLGQFFGRDVYRCYRLKVQPHGTDLHACLGGHHGYWFFT